MPPRKKLSLATQDEYITEDELEDVPVDSEEDDSILAAKGKKPKRIATIEAKGKETVHLRRGYFHKDEDTGEQILALPPKEKKPRTPAQIAAFQKMQDKREETAAVAAQKKEDAGLKREIAADKKRIVRLKKEKEAEDVELQNDIDYEDAVVRKAIAIKKRQIRRDDCINAIPDYKEPPLPEPVEEEEIPVRQASKYYYL